MLALRRFAAALVVAVATTSAAASYAAPNDPAPPLVAGIPQPCSAETAYPDGLTVKEVKAHMEKRWNLNLIGDSWNNDEYGPLLRTIWETLDAIDCTPFLSETRAKLPGRITINAGPITGYAWGDWGLTRPGAMSLDFAKLQKGYDDGEYERVVRVFMHEFGHVQSVDRGVGMKYWDRFLRARQQGGVLSAYAGRDPSETYADAVGYYVARCTPENPYNDPKNKPYYEYVRDHVFDGKEFGPPPGKRPNNC